MFEYCMIKIIGDLPKLFCAYCMYQVDRTLADNSIVIDKSRPIFSESHRLKKNRVLSESGSECERDEEVYDDIQFYSLLLKVGLFYQ